MNVLIKPSPLNGIVQGVSSKSYVQRALLCASLAKGTSIVSCNNFCDDVITMADCLRSIGAEIVRTDSGFEITGTNRFPDYAEIDCRDSGTALRFLLPVLAVAECPGRINVSSSLSRRPVNDLIDALNRNGAEISGLDIGKSKITGSIFCIPGNISSQYISGLILALTLRKEDSFVRLTSPLQSRGYVDMTIAAAASFGVDIRKNAEGFFISGGQKFLPCNYEAEADWSSAAYWISLGCAVSGLNENSLQPDSSFPSLIRENDINAENAPDLVPVLAGYAATRTGKTIIRGIERLKYKESDRIESIVSSLSEIGADIHCSANCLIIDGKDKLPGGTADSFNDHRIAMMLASASCRCTGDVIIKNAECISKSYPSFFETFSKLGGNIDVI